MENNSSGTRRSSKWDQKSSDGVKPSIAAAEVAAKLNAKLAAEGKLVQSSPPPLPPSSAASSSVIASTSRAIQACGYFTAEVEINNSLSRSELIKTTTLTEINRATGAFVSVRGKYMSLEEQKDGKPTEQLQYLHIQSTTQDRVNNAVQRIKAIMAGETTTKPSSSQHYVQDKVFIGMDQAPEAFRLLDRLSGPAGSYLVHISQQTGAKVYLRGKGSGYLEPTSGREAFEAMYLYISHPTHSGVLQAKKLCESLVSTVRKDLQQFNASSLNYAGTTPFLPPPPPPPPPPAAYNYMQQPPFYSSYPSHDHRMMPPQQYNQPPPLMNAPLPGAEVALSFPYFRATAVATAVAPYVGAPTQPLVAGSVPPFPHTVAPPPLLPTTVAPTTYSMSTTGMAQYSESSAGSADSGKITSSVTLEPSTCAAQTSVTTSTSDSHPPSKPAKRRFKEKPNIQAEILKSSLSVNTYTDVASESMDGDSMNRSQENIVTSKDEKDQGREQGIVHYGDMPKVQAKDEDKWKPIISTSASADQLLMPPPAGGFRRPSAAKRPSATPLNRTDEDDIIKVVANEKTDQVETDDNSAAKKMKLVVYGDSDSDND